MKYIAAFFILTMSAYCLHAQKSKREDVVFMNNGAIYRGKILLRDNQQLKVQTADGNVFVLNSAEVTKTEQQIPFGGYHPPRSGFAHYTELGPLVAGKTTIDGVTTAAFSFQTVNGYRFNQYAFAGAGIGIDLYATQTMLPLFGSLRGDLAGSGSIIPFYFADAGYAVNITQNSAIASDFKGGLLYAAGLGVKIPFNRSAGFLVSFGYRFQTSSYLNNGVKTTVDYRRLAIRAGFFL